MKLDGVTSIAEEADVLIAADVGRAASRMGDINGDGYTDLVFFRRADDNSQTVITAIMGGPRDVSLIDIPRVIDRAWIDKVLATAGQNRVRQLDSSSPLAFFNLRAELSDRKSVV